MSEKPDLKSSMVERVAKVIAGRNKVTPMETALARLAIAAMLNPTEEVERAGQEAAAKPRQQLNHYKSDLGVTARIAYDAMIKAALEN